MVKQSINWIYERLVCEFNHWDICLSGLIEDEGVYKFIKIEHDDPLDDYADSDEDIEYLVYDIEWNDACDEYLHDYMDAYWHWFYVDGKCSRMTGRAMNWFTEKYNHVNIIEKNIKE